MSGLDLFCSTKLAENLHQ